ncbi:MAG: tRNA pseudouridine(38-40) synthase TruA [Nocardioides sp.]|nr:tRNA pseudouridine(38-40) synthase TruA [Nocardioides sp.]
MRIRLDVAYDGTDFHGWATQPGLRTVQGELSDALATALRVDAVVLTCAGRTDTGVHARGQVVHLDVDERSVVTSAGRSSEPPLVALARRLNGIVGTDVRVRRVIEAPAGFDARFSALWRRYAYRIADRPGTVDPLTRSHVLVWSRELDLDLMNRAAEDLLGAHDFASFCRRREGATTIRTLQHLVWGRDEDGLAVASVRADAFCHNMVRSVVGCLLAIGDGRQAVGWAADLLAAQERDGAVTVAHPHGLTLEEVAYPPEAELGARVEITRNRRVHA